MSLVISAAVAASAATLPVCSWDSPGANAFKGDTVAAVDRYVDIPAPVRAALKQRMAARQFDEVAAIRRDNIEGRHVYTGLRDMHFGRGQVCRTVTRDKWPADAVERGLVYCESDHCLIVPTVCRNVSRVTRAPTPPGDAHPGAAAATDAPPPADGELQFDPPGAGVARMDNLPRTLASGGGAWHVVALAPTTFRDGLQSDFAAWSAPPLWDIDRPYVLAPGTSFDTVSAREQNGRVGRPGGWIDPEPAPVLGAMPWPGASPSPVPEPGSMALLAGGLAVLAAAVRRHRPVEQ